MHYEIQEIITNDLIFQLLEGYGQTENTGIATVTLVGDSEPGI